MAARIYSFIVHGNDYFIANLEGGGVRVGLIGCECYDFPASHNMHGVAIGLTAEAQAEELHDMITGMHCMERR